MNGGFLKVFNHLFNNKQLNKLHIIKKYKIIYLSSVKTQGIESKLLFLKLGMFISFSSNCSI